MASEVEIFRVVISIWKEFFERILLPMAGATGGGNNFFDIKFLSKNIVGR